jgi:hypothetical protein
MDFESEDKTEVMIMSATELSSSPFVSVSSHLLIVFCTDCK